MDIIKIILPIVLISLTAVYIVKMADKRAKQDKENNEEDNEKDNYMAEGMAIGMCLGTAIGIAFGQENIAVGTSIGMMLGMSVGMNIKKWSYYYFWNNLLASTYVGAFLLHIQIFFKIYKKNHRSIRWFILIF